MLPTEIADEIAKRSYAAAASAGLKSAHYPAPGGLPALPTMMVFWDGFDLEESNEQFWMLRYRGNLITSLGPIESQVVAVDVLALPIVDAFSPNLNSDNYHLGGGVDFCMLERGELSRVISYLNESHYGGSLFWRVKLRRFAGGS